jgi:hypothetical protein
MPGRYAKAEASSGFVAAIDTYAYRAPGAPAPATPGAQVVDVAPAAGAAEEAEAIPPTADFEDEAAPAAAPEVPAAEPATDPALGVTDAPL